MFPLHGFFSLRWYVMSDERRLESQIIHERHEHGHQGEESCREGWKVADDSMLMVVLAKEEQHSGGDRDPEPVYVYHGAA